MKKYNLAFITRNCGKIDPHSIDSYIEAGGYDTALNIFSRNCENIINEIKKSELRGRGGAGFPTGTKIEIVYKLNITPKFLVCNADEGEPGNFKDRFLLENDPHQLIEGMIITAYAAGISKGYIYIRGEYNKAIGILEKAIKQARQKGFLGKNIFGSGFNFDIEIYSGAGAYVCGEEFALIESIEGKAGRPRNKPPYPVSAGIFNQPTLINNVETLSTIPFIIREGAEKYTSIGTPSSKGTRLVSLSGNVNRRGVFEVPFGISVHEIIFNLGKGIPGGRRIKMVQLGGASGPSIPPEMIDLRLDYEEFDKNGLSMGAGAVIVIDDRHDILDILRNIMVFFRHESCGKCTP
ncbi:MAG: hypothetical protein QM315_08230, partial [Bacillota bacterium]|nr:hypothetical protein [Bacillota bacterium]